MKLFGAVIVHYFDLVAQVRRKENHCWTTSSFPCHPANRTNQFANCGWPIIVCGVLKDLRELVKNPQYIIVYKGYYFVFDSHIYIYWLLLVKLYTQLTVQSTVIRRRRMLQPTSRSTMVRHAGGAWSRIAATHLTMKFCRFGRIKTQRFHA